jgi:hypothetical protein
MTGNAYVNASRVLNAQERPRPVAHRSDPSGATDALGIIPDSACGPPSREALCPGCPQPLFFPFRWH